MARIVLTMMTVALLFNPGSLRAQQVDDERMQRDIEVAENVLATLIKQEMNQQRMFFPMEISGTYLPGYGVTFKLPMNFSAPFTFSFPDGNSTVIYGRDHQTVSSYSFRTGDEGLEFEEGEAPDANQMTLRDKQQQKRQLNMDSARNAYNQKIIQAAKDFIIDYGDFISQLSANEKIVITNQAERAHGWFLNAGSRTHISVEATMSDIINFKQGKTNRDQALSKIKVINTESIDEKEPDMELLTSIFNRLYRPDLSKTFFTEDNIYYERLKDYGAVFYMQVYSSNQIDYRRFSMPTIGLDNIDQETRDKNVKELYPKFENDVKENLLEYGRTLKSLGDEESLVFNITLTKCKGCDIPSSLELTVKSKVLRDFASNKIDKKTALGKINVKKGPNQ